MIPDISEKDRFKKYFIVDDNNCWIWIGGKLRANYGCFNHNKKSYSAHKFSYILYNQIEIPKGIYVLHRCDNPPCVNPEHLFLGTQKDNMNDAQSKGRQLVKIHPSLTSYARGCRCRECKDFNTKYSKMLYDKNKYRVNKRRCELRMLKKSETERLQHEK